MKQLTSLWDLKSTRGVADVRVSARVVPLNDAAPESPRPLADNPDRVAQFMRDWIEADGIGYDRETWFVLLLTTRRHVLAVHRGGDGTVDTLLVSPAAVFRPAIACNAAAIVMVHTHPSGDPSPSEGDIRVTRELIRAGQLLKIELLDHVIVANPNIPLGLARGYSSLRELGYWY